MTTLSMAASLGLVGAQAAQPSARSAASVHAVFTATPMATAKRCLKTPKALKMTQASGTKAQVTRATARVNGLPRLTEATSSNPAVVQLVPRSGQNAWEAKFLKAETSKVSIQIEDLPGACQVWTVTN